MNSSFPLKMNDTTVHNSIRQNDQLPTFFRWASVFIVLLLLISTRLKAQTCSNGTSCSANSALQLYGNASIVNGHIQLTAANNYQYGQAWSASTANLTNDFAINFCAYFGVNDATGADGITFVMRGLGSSPIGATGAGIGYGGITPSVAVEFDTYQNGSGYNDPTCDHTSYHVGGVSNAGGQIGSNVCVGTGGNIEDGAWHNIQIKWNASTKTLDTYFDGTLVNSMTRDIVALDFGGNPNVIFGYTASTGDFINEQNVCISSITNASADLSMTKTGPATVSPGGAVSYTLVVGNNGSAAANGATVSDPAVANFTAGSVSCSGASGGAVCPTSPSLSSLQAGSLAIPTLPSGGSVTLVVTGTAGSTNGAIITNTANVSAPAGITDPTSGNNTSTASTAIVAPVSASNVCPANTVDLATHINGTVPVGYTATWHTGTPATTANQLTPAQVAAAGAGTYYLALYDATNNCYGPTSALVVTIVPCATDLAVVKTGPATVSPSGAVSYTLAVTNNGPQAANGATVKDPSVANFTASSVSCASTSGGAVCPTSPTVAGLQAGTVSIPTFPASSTVILVVTGTAGSTNGSTITNVASVSAPSGVTDSNPANNSSTAVTSITDACSGTAVAYLQDFEGANALTYISANVYQPGQCSNGTIRTYTGGNHSGTKALYNTTTESCGSVYAALVWQNPTAITVTPNTSYTISYDITQEAASCMSNLSVTANGTTIGGPVSTPNSGGAWTFYTYSYVWNSGSATSLNVGIVNATACGAGNDFSLDNIKVVGATNTCADLSIVKTGATSTVTNGSVTYTLVVTNAGSSSANGATISDPAVANFTASSVSCAGTTGGAVCPASPTVASLQAGSLSIPTFPANSSVTLVVTGTAGSTNGSTITNVASVSAPAGITDSTPGNNSSTATTSISQPGTDLAVIKSGPATATPSGSVSYTLVVLNNGSSAANGAIVTDPSVSNFTASSVSCAGTTGSASCPGVLTVSALQGSGLVISTFPANSTVTLVITGTAGTGGSIINTAAVATPAGVTDSNPANNTSTVTTVLCAATSPGTIPTLK